MLNHRSLQQSHARQFVHLHPFYSAQSAMVSFAAALYFGASFDWKFFPNVFLFLILARELFHEFKHIKAPPHKEEGVFEDAEVREGAIKVGQLRHHETMPLVEIYTADDYLNAKAQASLLAPYYPDFYVEYFWYLFMVARVKHGPWNMSAIQFINQESRRRELSFNLDTIRLHYILKKINEALIQYNAQAPFYLQRSLDDFDMEHLRAILAFCEVEKGLGANGCSTRVIIDGNKKKMVRNLDWFTFEAFAKQLIVIAEPTPNLEADDTEETSCMTLVSTITPGVIPGITVFNNLGLGIAYNEVGGKKDNRENTAKAYPGLVLTKTIAAEYKSIKDVAAYLQVQQPASQCNLSIAASDGRGVIQCMPPGTTKAFTVLDTDVATNHFQIQNEAGEVITVSACVPCSVDRFEKMQKAPYDNEKKDSLLDIARSSQTKDTVETILAEMDDETGETTLQIRNATGYAPSAPDHNGNVEFSTFKLQPFFEELKEKIRKFNAAYNNSPERHEFMAKRQVDSSLIELMNKSNEISQAHPQLARELSDFCSALNERLVQREISMMHRELFSRAALSRKSIKQLADDAVAIVDAVLKNAPDKSKQFTAYRDKQNQMLPKARISYDGTKIVDALFIASMCVCMNMIVGYLGEKSPSINFSLLAYTPFLSDILEQIPRDAIGYTAGIVLATLSMFKKPRLIASAEQIASSLNKKMR